MPATNHALNDPRLVWEVAGRLTARVVFWPRPIAKIIKYYLMAIRALLRWQTIKKQTGGH